jgi:hypothetical protein
MFTARYALSPYIKQIRFVFKGLKYNEINIVSRSVCSYLWRFGGTTYCMKSITSHWNNNETNARLFVLNNRRNTLEESNIIYCNIRITHLETVPVYIVQERLIAYLRQQCDKECRRRVTSAIVHLQNTNVRRVLWICAVRKGTPTSTEKWIFCRDFPSEEIILWYRGDYSKERGQIGLWASYSKPDTDPLRICISWQKAA